MNPRVEKLTFESAHALLLTFTNKEVKLFDFSPYLSFPIYESLKDEISFKKARVFNGTVMWDESTDFDPDTLYLKGEAKP
jgi:hypothetical protein